MFADHDHLTALFQELADTVEGANAPTIQQMWTEFESGLLAHMEMEERHLFPLLARTDPEEVEALRAQHDEVRMLVAELGVRTDLHTLRREAVEALIDRLRNHARSEAELLYRRADELMSPEARREALAWMADERRRRIAALSGDGRLRPPPRPSPRAR